MAYNERPPKPELAGEILCVWNHRIDGERADAGHRVFPDGCVDIVWHDENPPLVVGPMTTGKVVRLPHGTQVTGIRLRPGVAQAWLDVNATELLDQEIALRDLWGPAADRLHDEIRESGYLQAPGLALDRKVAHHRPAVVSVDPRVTFAIEELVANPALQIETIANETGVGERQLRRLFLDSIGYGPKTLARIFRLQRAVAMFEQAGIPDRSLADIAFMAGYADQAHFTREVQVLAGAAPTIALPGAWCAIEAMSDSFKTIASS